MLRPVTFYEGFLTNALSPSIATFYLILVAQFIPSWIEVKRLAEIQELLNRSSGDDEGPWLEGEPEPSPLTNIPSSLTNILLIFSSPVKNLLIPAISLSSGGDGTACAVAIRHRACSTAWKPASSGRGANQSMTQSPDLPSLPPTHASGVEAWSTATVRCVLVPRGQQVDVELRNADGVAFLRKTVPDAQSANNEAAVLRLYVGDERRPRAWRGLKPFVIVAHNEGGTHQAFASALRAMGLRVLAVDSGRDATSAAQELVPDLIVLDDRLSDANAVDVCGQLRNAAETADIPIVIVTASPDAIHPRDPHGPDAVLAEPCGSDTIMATARLLLRDLIASEPAATAL